MDNISMSQHELYDTIEKLTKIVALQAAELRAMREKMCTACKQRCAALSTSTHQPSYDSSLAVRPLNQGDIEDDTPTLFRMPKMKGFWRTLASCSSYLSINEAITSISNSLAEISTKQTTDIDYPTIYAQKDDLADTSLDVEFVHSFCHEKKHVFSVCFSRDGSYLAVAIEEDDQGSIVVYGVESRAKYCELKEHVSQYGSYERPVIDSMCFSANGRYLVARDCDFRIIIWDLSNKRIRSIFQGRDDYYLSEVRFSPDGRLVAFCDDIELVVLNVRDNSRKMVPEWCCCFDFSPNGRHIATGNRNGDLAILDVRTGKAVKTWNGHGTHVFRVIFTSNGKSLLCGYRTRVIEHWDSNEAEPILIWKSDIENYLCDIAISPDNRLFVSSNDLRDVNSGKLHCTLEGHDDCINSIDFCAAGTYFAMGDYDGVVSLWKCRRMQFSESRHQQRVLYEYCNR